MVKTLKELKKLYPSKISTSGNIYIVDGFGRYRQRFTKFGIETYVEMIMPISLETVWWRTSFEKLVKEVEIAYNK